MSSSGVTMQKRVRALIRNPRYVLESDIIRNVQRKISGISLWTDSNVHKCIRNSERIFYVKFLNFVVLSLLIQRFEYIQQESLSIACWELFLSTFDSSDLEAELQFNFPVHLSKEYLRMFKRIWEWTAEAISFPRGFCRLFESSLEEYICTLKRFIRSNI